MKFALIRIPVGGTPQITWWPDYQVAMEKARQLDSIFPGADWHVAAILETKHAKRTA